MNDSATPTQSVGSSFQDMSEDTARFSRRNVVIALGVVATVVIADQLSKFWALSALADFQQIRVWGEFLRFSLVFNTGGAMGTNLGGTTYYLTVGIIILVALFWYLWTYRHELQLVIPLSLIAGGAIGNLTDRLRLGKVVDFIDMDFFDINLFGKSLDRWWTFNIADSAITVALVTIMYLTFFGAKKIRPHGASNPEQPLPSPSSSSSTSSHQAE